MCVCLSVCILCMCVCGCLYVYLYYVVASVVEWYVCSTAVREGTGSIPAGANVVIPVFPPKATCPLSSDEYLAL